jgi:hypothetical protein
MSTTVRRRSSPGTTARCSTCSRVARRPRTIADILRDIEREWRAELGAMPFAELKALLVRVWESPLMWPELSHRDD